MIVCNTSGRTNRGLQRLRAAWRSRCSIGCNYLMNVKSHLRFKIRPQINKKRIPFLSWPNFAAEIMPLGCSREFTTPDRGREHDIAVMHSQHLGQGCRRSHGFRHCSPGSVRSLPEIWQNGSGQVGQDFALSFPKLINVCTLKKKKKKDSKHSLGNFIFWNKQNV